MSDKTNTGRNVKIAFVFICCFLAGNFIEASEVYSECLEVKDDAKDDAKAGTKDVLLSVPPADDDAQTSPAPKTVDLDVYEKCLGTEVKAVDVVVPTPTKSFLPPMQSDYTPTSRVLQKCKQEVKISRLPGLRSDIYKKCVVDARPKPLLPPMKSDYTPNSRVFRKCKHEIKIPRLSVLRSPIYKKCVADIRPETFKSILFNKCRNLVSKLFNKCHPQGLTDAQRAHTKCHTSAKKTRAEEVYKKCHRDRYGKLSQRTYDQCHAVKPVNAESMFGKCAHLGHQNSPSKHRPEQHDQHDQHDQNAEQGEPNEPPPSYKQSHKDKLLGAGPDVPRKSVCKKGIFSFSGLKCYVDTVRDHFPMIKKMVVTAWRAIRGDEDHQKGKDGRYRPEIENLVKAKQLSKHPDKISKSREGADDHYAPETENQTAEPVEPHDE